MKSILVVMLLAISVTAPGQNLRQLKFATTAQVASENLASALSENPVYDTSSVYISNLIAIGGADTAWGNFVFGDTVDVDIFIRHVRFSGSLVFADTSARLDSLKTAIGGGVKTVSHTLGAYRGWYGYQFVLRFQGTRMNVGSATAYLRRFKGNELTK